jgi:hypothetical protein
MITYTMNKQTGAFDIIGPVESLREGATVVVTKKDGRTATVVVGPVSKPFIAKFGPCTGKQVAIAKVGFSNGGNASGGRGRGRGRGGRYECDECGEIVTPGTSCWETGMTH